MNRIRKGDDVIVIAGKDKGKRGSVLRVLTDGRLVVSDVNMAKRHTKPNPQKNVKGGVLEKEAPIHISNVQLVDPESKQATKVGVRVLDDGRRVRVARRSGAQLDK